jgi:hypothetical protein
MPLIRTTAVVSFVAAIALASLGGCKASSGPEIVHVPAGRYTEAFEAAVEAARQERLPAAMRDRRGGIIEAGPTVAGSLLEPWHNDGDSFGQVSENTLAHQRRRARFEFTPPGHVAEPPSEELIGPDVVALRDEPTDLTGHTGDLELRVWVFVERAHSPGVRRSTWSRDLTTRTRVIIGRDGEALPETTWTPVARDVAFERRLLAKVEEMLGVADAE